MATNVSGIMLLSGSGFLGASIVKTVSAKFEGLEEIFALNESGDTVLREIQAPITGVTMIDMEDAITKLAGVRVVIINANDNASITKDFVDGALRSGAFILLLSSTMESGELEEVVGRVRKTTPAYCILKLPLFYEDYLPFAEELLKSGQLFTSVDDDREQHRILADDVSKAIVGVLRNIDSFHECEHALFGERVSPKHAANTFSAVLGRPIEPKLISTDEFRDHLQKLRLPPSQIQRIVDLENLSRDDAVKDICFASYEDLFGRKATPLDSWIEAIEHRMRVL